MTRPPPRYARARRRWHKQADAPAFFESALVSASAPRVRGAGDTAKRRVGGGPADTRGRRRLGRRGGEAGLVTRARALRKRLRRRSGGAGESPARSWLRELHGARRRLLRRLLRLLLLRLRWRWWRLLLLLPRRRWRRRRRLMLLPPQRWRRLRRCCHGGGGSGCGCGCFRSGCGIKQRGRAVARARARAQGLRAGRARLALQRATDGRLGARRTASSRGGVEPQAPVPRLSRLYSSLDSPRPHTTRPAMTQARA